MADEIDLTKKLTDFAQMVRYGMHSDIGKEEIGRPVMEALRQHFLELDADRHHKWYKGEGFYAQAAKTTQMETSGDGVVFGTDRVGINLRLHGGFVVPVHAKYLTIPALPESYGKPARFFGNLSFVRFGRKDDESAPTALIEKKPKSATVAATGKKVRNLFKMSKNTQGAFGRRVFYWLVKSTTHRADPSVLPDINVLESIAEKSLEDYTAKFNF